MNDIKQLFDLIEIVTILAVGAWLLWRRPHLVITRQHVVWLGGLWLAFVSAPYWILGPYSFVDMSGDLDYMVPLLRIDAALPPGARFIHDFAGGVDAFGLAPVAGQAVSLERSLISLLPLWVAKSLHRVLVAGLWIVGAYVFARRVAGASRVVALGIAMLAAGSEQAATTFTFMRGVSIACLPLAVYLIVHRLGRRFYVSGVLAFAAFYAVSGSHPHGALSLFALLPFAAAMVSFRRVLEIAPALVAVGAAILLNWHEPLWALVDLGPYAARGNLGPLSGGPNSPLPEALHGVAYRYRELWAALAVAGGLAWTTNRRHELAPRRPVPARALAAVVLFPFLPQLFVEIPYDYLGLAVLHGFPFHYMRDGVPTLLILTAAILAARIGARRLPMFVAALFALAVGREAWLKSYEVANWFVQGGAWLVPGGGSTRTLRDLEDPAWMPAEPVRIAAVPYRIGENTLIAAGFASMDSHFSLGLARVSAYWAAVLRAFDPASETVPGLMSLGPRFTEADAKCCQIYDLDALNVGTTLMRIANVGFVVSRLPLAGTGVTKVAGPDDRIIPPRAGASLRERVLHNWRWMMDPPPVFVYSLGAPLPRVFAARGIEIVPDDMPLRELYALVERRGMDRVVIVTERDHAIMGRSTGSVSVRRFALTPTGIDIELEPGLGGVIAINISYLPFWSAKTDGVATPIVPANGIHMAVRVPPGSHRLELRYRREFFREKIERLLGLPNERKESSR